MFSIYLHKHRWMSLEKTKPPRCLMSLEIYTHETWNGPLELHRECFPSTSTSHSYLTQFHASPLSLSPPRSYPKFHCPSSLPGISFVCPFVQRKWKGFCSVVIEMYHPHLFQGKSHYPSFWELSAGVFLQSSPSKPTSPIKVLRVHPSRGSSEGCGWWWHKGTRALLGVG